MNETRDRANRRWRASPAGRVAVREYNRYRLRSEPEKNRARCAVRYALKVGKLVKPDRCEECGSASAVRAHHHMGYAPENKLDVRWLCDGCHHKEHDR